MPMKSTLTVRLTVLYTLVAATVLSGLAVLVLMTTHQHFVELDQAFMLEKAKLIQDSAKGKQGLEEVSQRIKEIAESHHGMYLQLWSNKALVVGSSALEVPQLLSTADNPPGQLVDWVANGTPLRGLSQDVELKSDAGIDHYSQRALARIWRAERFSWWLTSLMHQFPETGAFGQKMQEAELEYLVNSPALSASLSVSMSVFMRFTTVRFPCEWPLRSLQKFQVWQS